MNFLKYSRGWVEKILFSINIFNSLLILICCILNYYYHPIFSFFSFLTFLFPIIFLLNIIFLIYWLIKIDVRVLLSLIVVAILSYNSFFFYKLRDTSIDNREGFHIMSFNARLFNHYKWIKNENIPADIKEFVFKKKPDLLAIQEYHGDYQYLLDSFKNKHIHLSGNNVGQSIHTNYKIIERGIVDFDNSINNAIFVDLLIDKDTLRVYNAHFESFKVDLLNLKTDFNSFKRLINKIKTVYLAQKEQSNTLINDILKSPHKVILAIDLNNTQHSFVYNEIKNKMMDMFELKGYGFGSTYDFKFMPIRIDYIFVSKSISPKFFEIHNIKLSDHKPISAFIDF